MRVHIRYFASLREAVGTGHESLETSATTLAQLRESLAARGGAYAELRASGKVVRVALNQTLRDESATLTDGCEVAFFPPVTGG